MTTGVGRTPTARRLALVGALAAARIATTAVEPGAQDLPPASLLTLDRPVVYEDLTKDAGFGTAIAISGDTLVVGAVGHEFPVEITSSAYVFERDAGGPDAFGQIKKLDAPAHAAGDRFGASVAIHGDTVVVGAPRKDDDGTDAGAAYVFERNAGGPDAWGLVAALSPTGIAPGHGFGGAVAMDGDTVVVGSKGDDDPGMDAGAVHVFERDAGGPGNWGEVAKIGASDAAPGDRFGAGVAIGADVVVVGAERDDDPSVDSGAIYVFERNAGGPGAWGQVRKLLVSGPAPSGHAVAVSGTTAIVGAANADTAYGFERDAGGTANWGQVDTFHLPPLPRGEYPYNDFGDAVALEPDTLLIGSPESEVGGIVFAYERLATGWSDPIPLRPNQSGVLFGDAVAIDGDVAVVGMPRGPDVSPVLRPGAAYLFEEPCDPAPTPGCITGWGQVTFSWDEGAPLPDLRRWKVKLAKGPALDVSSFGTPSRHRVCIYDDADARVGGLDFDVHVLAFRPFGGASPRGFVFKGSKGSYQYGYGLGDGLFRMKLQAGNAGRTQIRIEGAGTGVPTTVAARLAGSSSMTIEIHGSDPGTCFSATLTDVVRADGTAFRARN